MVRPRRAVWLAFLSVLQVFVLACGSLQLPSQLNLSSVVRIAGTPAPAYGDATPTPPPATASQASLIRRRGRLLVGVRFDAPPLSSVNAKGELEGLDIDLARGFARRWLGGPEKVEFSQVTSTSALRRIANREIDMAMGGIAATKAGELQVDYSLSHIADGDALLVRTGAYTSVASLARKSVVYVDLENIPSFRTAQFSAGITTALQSLTSYPAAFAALRGGTADAVLGNWRRLRLEAASGSGLSVLSVLRREPLAIALPQGDPDWTGLVNATLTDQFADGSFDALYAKWFKAPAEGTRPLALIAPASFASLPDTLTARSSLAGIARTRKLRVGYLTNSDPLSFANREQPNGFEVDLIRELAKRWFDAEAAAVFTPYGTEDALAAAMQANTIDAGIGDLRPGPANARRFDFTPATFLAGVGALTLASNKALTFGDLGGKTIGLLRNGPDQQTLATLKQARGVVLNEVVFADTGSALQALRSGQISAVVADRVTLFAVDRVNRDTKMLGDQLSAAPVGIAVAAGDSALKNALSLGLQEMLSDGAFIKLYRKWLDEPFKPPFDALPGETVPSRSLVSP